jgi:hypothetical protein
MLERSWFVKHKKTLALKKKGKRQSAMRTDIGALTG